MPVSTVPYTRKYAHTKSRGRETSVVCGTCGRQVPRYKTFVMRRGLRITDPVILQQVDRRMIHMLSQVVRICPACARFQGVVRPGKSVRKKHLGR